MQTSNCCINTLHYQNYVGKWILNSQICLFLLFIFRLKAVNYTFRAFTQNLILKENNNNKSSTLLVFYYIYLFFWQLSALATDTLQPFVAMATAAVQSRVFKGPACRQIVESWKMTFWISLSLMREYVIVVDEVFIFSLS